MKQFPREVHYMLDIQIFPDDEKPIYVRWINSANCVECHSFSSYPEAMLFVSTMCEHQYALAFKKEIPIWRDIPKQKSDE